MQVGITSQDHKSSSQVNTQVSAQVSCTSQFLKSVSGGDQFGSSVDQLGPREQMRWDTAMVERSNVQELMRGYMGMRGYPRHCRRRSGPLFWLCHNTSSTQPQHISHNTSATQTQYISRHAGDNWLDWLMARMCGTDLHADLALQERIFVLCNLGCVCVYAGDALLTRVERAYTLQTLHTRQ